MPGLQVLPPTAQTEALQSLLLLKAANTAQPMLHL